MRTYNLLLFGVMLVLLATSCVSTKKLIYLQGADKMSDLPEQVTQNYELTIQKDDQLSISISSKDRELLEPFGNKIQFGENALSMSSSIMYQPKLSYYKVDSEGNIDLPFLGSMTASGFTLGALEEQIERKLITDSLLKDPQITVKLMNFKVAVLGAVARPGQFTVDNERITILEALAQAGDLNVSAIRRNLLVLREENGARTSHSVDLTSADLTQSDYYYLRQNDVIYVAPNQSIVVQSSPFWTFFSAGSSVVSLLISVVTLVIISGR